MKKFLLTAALVLALVTSLTAGTMAAYTQKVETIKADIQTKTFSITADQNSGSFIQNLKIAPGDQFSYKVKVNNASEVRSDVDVAVALTKTYEGLTVSIDKTNNGNGDGKNGNTKISNDGKLASTLIAEAGSQEYVVTVAWDYAKGLTKDAGQSTTLSIDINGTQHNDQNTLTTSDTAAKS